MTRPDLYWHIYAKDQIKPALRGRFIYLLEVATAPDTPVIRDIFDPAGREFETARFPRPRALANRVSHGIVYVGVSRTAVYDLVSFDPPVGAEDPQFTVYNRKVIANSRSFFLINPNLGFEMMPVNTLRLVCGSRMSTRNLIGF